MIGFAYIQKSEFKTAIKYLESARKKGGENLEVLQFLADCYVKVNEFSKAELLLTKILRQQEDNAQAWKNLGLVYAARDEYEEALRVLVKANNFNPSDLSVAILAGNVYIQCGKLNDAWKAFDAVLSVDKNSIQCLLGMARIHMLSDKIQDAFECVKKAEKIGPKNEETKILLSEIYTIKEDYETAIDILDQLIEEHPSNGMMRALRARNLKLLGQLEEAGKEYLKALQFGAEIESTIPEYVETIIHNSTLGEEEKSKIIRRTVKRFPIKEVLTYVPDSNSEPNRPINLAFISDKIWDNSTGLEILDLIKHMPKDELKITVYSTNRKNDAITRAISKQCHIFNFVFKISPVELRETILKHQIDILVDYSTEYVKLINKVIQRKPSPLMLKWAEFATNPLELRHFDYVISKGNKHPIYGAKYEPSCIMLPDSSKVSAPILATHFYKGIKAVWDQKISESGKKRKSRSKPDIVVQQATDVEINQVLQKSEHIERTDDTSDTLIPESFWGGNFSDQRAESTVETTRKFFSDDFTPKLLSRIVEETKDRLETYLTDNRAFFVQSRALQAMPPENEFQAVTHNELDKNLREKKWWFKRAIYNHWFEKVEWKKQAHGTKVSAIIIANKFKKRSVENLLNLNHQLRGIGEIIFVNNGLDDSEFEALMPYITTYVKANGNSGAYLARNLGAIFAKGEYLIFVDDDGIPDKGFVEAHLKEHTERDAIVSRGVYYSSNVIVDPLHYNIGTKVKPAYTILEGNAMYKAEAFYKVGGWGDYILFGHGGKDLSYRLLEFYPNKEQQIYVPGSRLHHEYFRGESHKSEKIEKQAVSMKLIEALHPGLTETIETWPTEFSASSNRSIETNSPALLVLPENKSSKFIHLCRNHVYAQSLSDMIKELNKNSDQQHWLLVEKTPWDVGGEGYSIDENKNTSTLFFDCRSQSDIDGIIRELIHPEVSAVFFHGLFRQWEFYLLNAIGNKQHIGWIIWGGDLYKPIQRNQDRVFPHQLINSIHTVIDGDIELFTRYYGEKDSYSFSYPYPALYGDIHTSTSTKMKKIIVGNSGDASNNHIEILKQLARKDDIHEYELILPVAYNFNANYKEEVIQSIRDLGLSENVRFHDSFLSPEQYRTLVSEVDMMIMAHERQQAMGNTLMGLYFNKPVFLKKEISVKGENFINPSWTFLEDNGLSALPFEDFNTFNTLEEITKVNDQYPTKNQKIIKENFGLKVRAELFEHSCAEIHKTRISEKDKSSLVNSI